MPSSGGAAGLIVCYVPLSTPAKGPEHRCRANDARGTAARSRTRCSLVLSHTLRFWLVGDRAGTAAASRGLDSQKAQLSGACLAPSPRSPQAHTSPTLGDTGRSPGGSVPSTRSRQDSGPESCAHASPPTPGSTAERDATAGDKQRIAQRSSCARRSITS